MASSELVIRPARVGEDAALVRVLLETFESTWRPQISVAAAKAHLEQGRAAAYVSESGLEFWVADLEGQIVGLIHWRDDFVHALHVRPSHARSGVGSRLMDRAEADIASSGFEQVRLETDTFNLASQALYRSRCYREAGRYPDKEWNSGLTTILLVKSLG
jgi:ribosomal protein S18 acetylase RimI-like enzyme